MNPLIQFASDCVDCGASTFTPQVGPRCEPCYREYLTLLRMLNDHPDMRSFDRQSEFFYGFEFGDGERPRVDDH